MTDIVRKKLSRRQFLVGGAVAGSTGALAMAGLMDPKAAAAAGGDLTFFDNFARPDSSTAGNGWQPLRGNWAIVSDSLETTGGTTEMDIEQTAFQLGRTFAVEAKLSVGGASGAHNGIAFNIHDNGDGTQNLYVLSLTLNSPPTWWLWEVHNSQRTRLYGSGGAATANVVPNHQYTLQVSSTVYGYFDVTILDGSTELLSERVQIDPLAQQLAGGYAGVFSEGNGGGTLQVFEERITSTTALSTPPQPPPLVPLNAKPVNGPPYQLSSTSWTVVNSSTVDQTNSRLAVGQSLLTKASNQYVAYYNGSLQMTVAQRSVTSDTWVRQPLNEYIGWDAHNSVGMAFDRAGQLHVAGDMHNVPLIYFRTSVPGDVTSLTKIASMVDPSTERSETYPVFLYNAQGALIYNYRDGSSGNGSTYYNIYDETTQTWSRLFDQALFDGQGDRSAYYSTPALGPDGYFHMSWVWRDTADGATNSNLSYARSPDLVSWQTIEGAPVTLPITYSTPGVIVDPVPIYNGLWNNEAQIGFDANKNVIISYYKFDRNWNAQVYFARPKPGVGWKIIQASSWTGRYELAGIGAVPGLPSVSPVSTLPDGNL
ncbi:MAG: BNR-4 repeat-containing protein, partial [Mycobacterium sp.]|nr:BNR-4 repeat-containing protein [Mycobacterium sp.]